MDQFRNNYGYMKSMFGHYYFIKLINNLILHMDQAKRETFVYKVFIYIYIERERGRMCSFKRRIIYSFKLVIYLLQINN